MGNSMTSRSSAGPKTRMAIILTVATGVIHASIGIGSLGEGESTVAGIFLAMAVPYFAGATLLYTGFRPRLTVGAGLAYTILLLLAWAVAGTRSPLAYMDKAIELVLAVLLVMLLRHPAARWSTATDKGPTQSLKR